MAQPRRELRILAFADLHLDRAFPWAEPDAGQAARASRQLALEAICAIAAAEADVLVSAGDLYDQDHHHPDTGELLRDAFEGLAPMPVLLVPGESDPPGRLSLYERVTWSPNVHPATDGAAGPQPLEVAQSLTLWSAAGPNAFEGFAAPALGIHVGLTHWEPPGELDRSGGLHALIAGHQHRPYVAGRVICPGAAQPAHRDDPVGGVALISIFDDGTVATAWRELAGTPPASPPHRFSTAGLRQYDLALLGEEQTVRGEFVRDLLAATEPPEPHLRRLGLLSGLEALAGRRLRVQDQTRGERNGGSAGAAG